MNKCVIRLVIANAVKQSRELTQSLDCFVPRSDAKRKDKNKPIKNKIK